MKNLRLPAAAAALLILAGCGGSHAHAATARAVSTHATATPSATPTAISTDDYIGAMSSRDLSTVATLPSEAGGRLVAYDGLLDDHTAYGEQSLRNDESQSDAVITDVRTKRATVLSVGLHGIHVVLGIAAAPGWLVWTEAVGGEPTRTWTVYSYEVATKRIRTIATAPADQRFGFFWTGVPSVAGKTVYLAAVSYQGSAANDTQYAIYSAPVDGQSPLKRFSAGSRVQASGNQVYVAHGSHLERHDLVSGAVTRPAPGCDAAGEDCVWGVGGGDLAYDTGHADASGSSTIHVVRADGTSVSVRTIGEVDDGTAVVPGGSILTLSSGDLFDDDSGYVADLTHGFVLTLPFGSAVIRQPDSDLLVMRVGGSFDHPSPTRFVRFKSTK